MNARTTSPWIASAGLHGLLLILAVYTWKVTPISNPDPAISVEIISEVASTIGQDTEMAETASELTEASEPVQEPAKTEDLPPEAITPPPPKALPKIPPPPAKAAQTPVAKPPPPKIQPPITKTVPKQPQPIAKAVAKQPTPKLPPPIAKPTPTPTTKSAQRAPAPTPARPAPQAKGQTSPLFDIAAATKSASGVNAGGRRAPQLSKSAGTATKAKGSGSRLQGNLAGALRQQIKNCWYEPADLSNPGRLIVEIAIELSPDGNLARPPRLITPASRSGADSTLLIAIDNAIRAARQCAPYDLPSDRYDEWQSFNFRFDPREMRRVP